MLTHVVIFRTRRKDMADMLYEGAKKLGDIDFARGFYCGKPVPSARPVVDDFFDVAICVHLDNKDALARYASDPIHVNFVENCIKPAEAKLTVFDFADD